MKYIKMLLIALGVMLGFSNAFAADPTDVAGVVTAAQAVSTTATSTYLAAAILGLGMVTVGIVFYVLRRGVKTR